MKDSLLGGNVELIKSKMWWVDRERSDSLAGWEPLERRHLQLDHKEPAGSRCLATLRKHSTCLS